MNQKPVTAKQYLELLLSIQKGNQAMHNPIILVLASLNFNSTETSL